MKRMLGLVGCLLLAWSAHSQTYTYQGSPIGGITPSGSFSTDTPLLANGVQTLSPTDWSFIGNIQNPADAWLNMTTANYLDSQHNAGGDFSFATFTVTTQKQCHHCMGF